MSKSGILSTLAITLASLSLDAKIINHNNVPVPSLIEKMSHDEQIGYFEKNGYSFIASTYIRNRKEEKDITLYSGPGSVVSPAIKKLEANESQEKRNFLTSYPDEGYADNRRSFWKIRGKSMIEGAIYVGVAAILVALGIKFK